MKLTNTLKINVDFIYSNFGVDTLRVCSIYTWLMPKIIFNIVTIKLNIMIIINFKILIKITLDVKIKLKIILILYVKIFIVIIIILIIKD